MYISRYSYIHCNILHYFVIPCTGQLQILHVLTTRLIICHYSYLATLSGLISIILIGAINRRVKVQSFTSRHWSWSCQRCSRACGGRRGCRARTPAFARVTSRAAVAGSEGTPRTGAHASRTPVPRAQRIRTSLNLFYSLWMSFQCAVKIKSFIIYPSNTVCFFVV